MLTLANAEKSPAAASAVEPTTNEGTALGVELAQQLGRRSTLPKQLSALRKAQRRAQKKAQKTGDPRQPVTKTSKFSASPAVLGAPFMAGKVAGPRGGLFAVFVRVKTKNGESLVGIVEARVRPVGNSRADRNLVLAGRAIGFNVRRRVLGHQLVLWKEMDQRGMTPTIANQPTLVTDLISPAATFDLLFPGVKSAFAVATGRDAPAAHNPQLLLAATTGGIAARSAEEVAFLPCGNRPEGATLPSEPTNSDDRMASKRRPTPTPRPPPPPPPGRPFPTATPSPTLNATQIARCNDMDVRPPQPAAVQTCAADLSSSPLGICLSAIMPTLGPGTPLHNIEPTPWPNPTAMAACGCRVNGYDPGSNPPTPTPPGTTQGPRNFYTCQVGGVDVYNVSPTKYGAMGLMNLGESECMFDLSNLIPPGPPARPILAPLPPALSGLIDNCFVCHDRSNPEDASPRRCWTVTATPTPTRIPTFGATLPPTVAPMTATAVATLPPTIIPTVATAVATLPPTMIPTIAPTLS